MISYSTVQRAFAQELHRRLVERGCSPKLDHLDIPLGDFWRQTIAWWLSACQTAVILFSPEAVKSPWVRYELGVLVHRALTGDDVRLVPVCLGISQDDVCRHPDFAPFDLSAIEFPLEPITAEPDEAALDKLAETIDRLANNAGTPIDRLVDWVHDEVQPAGPGRVELAHQRLQQASARTTEDPWLDDPGVTHRDPRAWTFARTFCSTPLHHTYGSLDVLAHDRQLSVDGLLKLIDLNVMTTFDPKLVDHLVEAARQPDRRRSLVAGLTQADLAALAARTIHERGEANTAFCPVINAPVTGSTPAMIADGLTRELCHAIEAFDPGSDPDEILDELAELEHPVFALLARADGISREVLGTLEERFPTVVFVVLASAAQTLAGLSENLGIEGAGPILDGDAWVHYVEHEQLLTARRIKFRKSIRRAKRENDA